VVYRVGQDRLEQALWLFAIKYVARRTRCNTMLTRRQRPAVFWRDGLPPTHLDSLGSITIGIGPTKGAFMQTVSQLFSARYGHVDTSDVTCWHSADISSARQALPAKEFRQAIPIGEPCRWRCSTQLL
jgi:hypothetical protein